MARTIKITPYHGSTTAGEFPKITFNSKDGAADLMILRVNDAGTVEMTGASGGVMTLQDGIPSDNLLWKVNDNSGLTALSLDRDGTIKLGRPLYNDFVIDSSGNVTVGDVTTADTLFHVLTTSPTTEAIQLESVSATADAGSIGVYKHRGTHASPTATQSGDGIGSFTCLSYGSSKAVVSNIITKATELHSGSALGSEIEFYVIPNTTTSTALALTIEQDQGISAVGRFVNETFTSFSDADATPSVSSSNFFQEVNTGSTSITAFDNGISGQKITVLFTTANTTIVDGANLHLSGGANFVGSADDVLELVYNGTSWFEVSRSVN